MSHQTGREAGVAFFFFFITAASATADMAAVGFRARFTAPGAAGGRPIDPGQAMATTATLLPAVAAGVVDRMGFFISNLFFGPGGAAGVVCGGDAPAAVACGVAEGT